MASKFIVVALIASCVALVPTAAYSQKKGGVKNAPPSRVHLSPQWFGTWKDQKGNNTIVISKEKLDAVRVTIDKEGKREWKYEHSWLDKPVAEVEGGKFGYWEKSTSRAEIANRLEAAITQYKRDPMDFHVGDPTASRRAVAAISPGRYKVVWSYQGGDCAIWDYILDGDRMLEVSQCKYRFAVNLFKRVAGAPGPVAAAPATTSTASSAVGQIEVPPPDCRTILAVGASASMLPKALQSVESFTYYQGKINTYTYPKISLSADDVAAFRKNIISLIERAATIAAQECKPRTKDSRRDRRGRKVTAWTGAVLVFSDRISHQIPPEALRNGKVRSYSEWGLAKLSSTLHLRVSADWGVNKTLTFKNIALYRERQEKAEREKLAREQARRARQETMLKRKQAQEEAAQREKSAAQQKEAARDARIEAFGRKHGFNVKDPGAYAILFTNPFALEGKSVVVPFILLHMQTATTGIFKTEGARGRRYVVSDIPRRLLVRPINWGIVAGTVLGNTKPEGSAISVPHLKYRGVMLCDGDVRNFETCNVVEER